MAAETNTGVLPENFLPGVPLVESPLFNSFFRPEGPNADIYESAKFLNEHGYVVIRNIIPDVEALCDEIKANLTPEFKVEEWRDMKRSGVKCFLRLQDTYNRFASVRKLAASEIVLKLLSRLYGRQAFPFQTLNFPVGTEQHYHADSIHFSSYPEKFMCGVWVALEDIGPDQGPLMYYPGSHKLPVFENVHYGINTMSSGGKNTQVSYQRAWQAIVDSLKLEPHYFHAKKGDLLIWCANLLHGGSPHTDISRTRWSQVTHYYFDDCSYYTPMHSDPFVKRMALRTPINLVDGSKVGNKFLGNSLREEEARNPAENTETLPVDFDPQRYLQIYPDLRIADVDPVKHFLNFGRKEGRRYK